MPVHLRCLVLASLSAVTLPSFADGDRTILVLDGSGSMWGQIDGRSKIEIAREVVGDLLGDLPDTLQLGLTVYGHRRKGDCTDIESVVAPAPGTRERVRDAIASIVPKGKTPLSAAVLAAAEELKYGEEKATVVLVSDGGETCDADPCEVGRRLERLGVDFTAHVIGFDVPEETDRAQLRCLAEETGGEFVGAANASELSAALERVSTAPPIADVDVTPVAEPAPRVATVSESEAITIETVEAVEAGEPVEIVEPDRPAAAGEPGETDRSDETGRPGETDELVEPGEIDKPVMTLVAEGAGEVSLEARLEVAAQKNLAVDWIGPDIRGDYIAIALPDMVSTEYLSYAFTTEGSPLLIEAPLVPSRYELRYVLGDTGEILARRPLRVVAE